MNDKDLNRRSLSLVEGVGAVGFKDGSVSPVAGS